MVLIFVLFCFAFSLLRFMFFGWSYRPFVLGQSVPPPPHLPGGFPEKPESGWDQAAMPALGASASSLRGDSEQVLLRGP